MELLLDGIGFFGPVILFITSLMKLIFIQPYLLGYLVLSVINLLINRGLKSYLQVPRPKDSRSFIGEQYEKAEQYGMPSHHAQSVFFSLTYNYLAKPQLVPFIFELFICIVTLLQRRKYNNHTWDQLLVGSLIGCVLGIVGANYIRSQLRVDWEKGEKIEPEPVETS